MELWCCSVLAGDLVGHGFDVFVHHCTSCCLEFGSVTLPPVASEVCASWLLFLIGTILGLRPNYRGVSASEVDFDTASTWPAT